MNEKLECNPIVTNMAEDVLLNFQVAIKDIEDIVKLTFGEPGFGVDERIKAAAIKAIANDRSHYAESQGETALRQVVVDYFVEKYNVPFKEIDNVIVTLGVTEAINIVFQTLLSAGDGLLIPEPAYGPYWASLDLAHGVRIPINTLDDDLKLTPVAVQKAIDGAQVPVKAILMNYPNNPTGVTYTKAELEALVAVFKANNIWVISDEIYSELTYDIEHTSLASLWPEQTIMINGLSKSHAMTGYRVGFVLANQELVKDMQKVHGALTFALPEFIQDAALVALKEVTDTPKIMKEAYRARRDRTVPKLEALGFELANPSGAFYLFAKIPSDLGDDSEQFALELAREGRVAVVPGIAFSPEARQYIRISYAADDAQLDEGIARLTQFVLNKRK